MSGGKPSRATVLDMREDALRLKLAAESPPLRPVRLDGRSAAMAAGTLAPRVCEVCGRRFLALHCAPLQVRGADGAFRALWCGSCESAA